MLSALVLVLSSLGAGLPSLALPQPLTLAESPKDFPKLSPFQAVRWRDQTPEVRVDERWYELLAIDALEAKAIVAFCRDKHGEKWRKRFEEDLVEVLDGMRHRVERHVALKLLDLESRQEKQLARVEMTEAHRTAILAAARARRESERPAASGSASAPVRRVERAHAPAPAAAYAFLARFPAIASGRALTRAQAEQDLDQLEWLIEHQYSYARLRGVDTRAALDAVRCGLGPSVDLSALALQVMKLMALYGDGHSGLTQGLALLPPGYAPFLVEDLGGKLIAFKPDRSAFLDPLHPVLVSIDGLDVERWIEAAAALEARGSAQMTRRRAVRGLRPLACLALELGKPLGASFEVELAALDGTSRAKSALKLSDKRPIYGQRVESASRTLDGGVGYLRLAQMDDAAESLDEIDAAMQRFRNTRGLIVDVRENGGGSRAALRRLFPYFASADEAPFVANVAAYKLCEGEAADKPDGYLADRWLFPLSAEVWGERERAAIGKLASSFRPEWAPPANEFSAWHYFVLRREDNPKAFRYERPVIVLMDEGCFSATDIFLSALKGRAGITLVGAPSSGGSGRAAVDKLANSALELRLSSMASFRPDGTLFEGRGVEPDVHAKPVPADLLRRSDSVLDAALARLRAR